MKIVKTIVSVLSVLLLVTCGNNKQETDVNTSVAKQAIPVVDVTKSYPKKEIILQDIADVEYIPLETRDDVLVAGARELVYVSQDTIVVCNQGKGDILFFNGQGKFLHSFNKKGQSGREYLSMIQVVFDALYKEVYVYDILGGKRRIQVYSDKGIFKRTLSAKFENSSKMVNYNAEKLLAFEDLVFGKLDRKIINTMPFLLIDKKTGKIDTLKRMNIKDRESPVCMYKKGEATISISVGSSYIKQIEKCGKFVLDELSCDTIFEYSKTGKLTPICIKIPKLKMQGDNQYLVAVDQVSEKWIFLRIRPRNFGDNKEQALANYKKYSSKLKQILNRETHEILNYKLKNKDIDDATFKVAPSTVLQDVDNLIELLEDGKLKGKLKEIAENLKEDDNPVLMKITFKN